MRQFERDRRSGLLLPKGVRPLAIGACGPAFFAAAAVAGSGSTTTWSPTDKTGGWSVSGGNLTASGNYVSGSAESIRATTGSASTKKVYWELNIGQLGSVAATDSLYFGVSYGPALQAITSIASPYWLINGDGTVFSAGGSGSGGGGALATGGVLMFAYDHDNKLLWIGYNGTWRNSGNPGAGTGQVYTFTATNPRFPLLQIDGADGGVAHVVTLNCGASGFTYAVPSGFTALGAP